jgi:SAM-dependent methyltransferase
MNDNQSKIIGSDFSDEQMKTWYEQEENAYHEMPRGRPYEYHAMNSFYGFRHVALQRIKSVLAYGSIDGEELKPILGEVRGEVYCADASSAEATSEFKRIKIGENSSLPMKDGSIDMITCFGVLHHVCRPQDAVQEFHRVLSKGGIAIIREPITSMNFGKGPRPRCTPNERGLPYLTFEEITRQFGFRIQKKFYCFSPFFRLGPVRRFLESIGLMTVIDSIYSNFIFPRPKYFWNSLWDKARPGSCLWILEKM